MQIYEAFFCVLSLSSLFIDSLVLKQDMEPQNMEVILFFPLFSFISA